MLRIKQCIGKDYVPVLFSAYVSACCVPHLSDSQLKMQFYCSEIIQISFLLPLVMVNIIDIISHLYKDHIKL